jgi:hypothetical protein
MADSEAHLKCRNCDALMHGSYCAQCGQHDVDYHRSFRFVIADSLDEFFHVDGKFLKTVGCLFTRPGLLTQEFIAGRRVRYAHPLRFYIFVSFLSFLALAFVPARFTEGNPPRTAKKIAATAPGDSESKKSEANFWPRIRETLSPEVLTSQAFPRELRHLLPATLLLCIPLLALFLKLTYASSHRFYIEHLIFALHIQAFVLLTTLIGGGILWCLREFSEVAALSFRTALFVWVLYVIYRALRVVYRQGARTTTLKFITVGVPYVIIVELACLGTGLVAALVISHQRP